MKYASGGAARHLETLGPREAQDALAEEFEAMTEEATAEIDPEAEKAPIDQVFAAVEAARQARMAEALLFAAAEPLDEATIAARLPDGADVRAILDTLRAQYENRGVNLACAGGRWRFMTAPDVAPVLETLKIEPRKVSRAALETLAIIAYHQPCTRADIEEVRGVAVSPGSIDQLLEIGWIRMRGRRRTAPGRPILYGTTPAFLEHFTLESVADLPGMADLKAAGLLDARLPPDFRVPTPVDGDALPDDASIDGGADGEFVTDFHDDDPVAEG